MACQLCLFQYSEMQHAIFSIFYMVIGQRLKTQDSKVFIWPLFTFSQIAYNKQLHKFLIYMVKETSIKTTCGRWHGSHLYGNENGQVNCRVIRPFDIDFTIIIWEYQGILIWTWLTTQSSGRSIWRIEI